MGAGLLTIQLLAKRQILAGNFGNGLVRVAGGGSAARSGGAICTWEDCRCALRPMPWYRWAGRRDGRQRRRFR